MSSFHLPPKKNQQHLQFPSSLPSQYYPGPMLLDISDRTRTSLLNTVWPLARYFFKMETDKEEICETEKLKFEPMCKCVNQIRPSFSSKSEETGMSQICCLFLKVRVRGRQVHQFKTVSILYLLHFKYSVEIALSSKVLSVVKIRLDPMRTTSSREFRQNGGKPLPH